MVCGFFSFRGPKPTDRFNFIHNEIMRYVLVTQNRRPIFSRRFLTKCPQLQWQIFFFFFSSDNRMYA